MVKLPPQARRAVRRALRAGGTAHARIRMRAVHLLDDVGRVPRLNGPTGLAGIATYDNIPIETGTHLRPLSSGCASNSDRVVERAELVVGGKSAASGDWRSK